MAKAEWVGGGLLDALPARFAAWRADSAGWEPIARIRVPAKLDSDPVRAHSQAKQPRQALRLGTEN